MPVVFQINLIMKKIIFYISLLTIIVIGVTIWNVSFNRETVPLNEIPGNPLPIVDVGTSYPNTTSYVAAKNGTRVPVRDFLQSPSVSNAFDEAVYVLSTSATTEGRVLYEIFYFTTDNTIVISLQDYDLAFAREGAENELRQVLGVTDNELCSLEIRVTVPGAVSEEYSGRNLGLSFCVGNVRL